MNNKNVLNMKWLDEIFKCTETSYVVDENSKELLWTNNAEFGDMVNTSTPCYKAFFGLDTPCAGCEKLTLGKVQTWEHYDKEHKHWLKVKNLLFYDNGKLLRVGNFNQVDDIMALSNESVAQMSELQKLLLENQRIKDKLEYEATHDKMTGLLNRNKFNLDIASHKYDTAGTGALYFDLNNLKKVNDKYRHEAGDMLIICLANAISKTVEKHDNATAYRLGGDEFLVLLANSTEEMLHKVHADFSQFLSENQSDPLCVVAIGEAFSAVECNAEKLVSTADQAMYKNKQFLKSLGTTV